MTDALHASLASIALILDTNNFNRKEKLFSFLILFVVLMVPGEQFLLFSAEGLCSVAESLDNNIIIFTGTVTVIHSVFKWFGRSLYPP